MTDLSQFTKQFSKVITIKNELVPVAQTLDFIKKNNIIEEDLKRSEDFKRAKEILDEKIYRVALEESLESCDLNWQKLANAIEEVNKVDKDNDKARDAAYKNLYSESDKLRKEIVKKYDVYANQFNDVFLKKDTKSSDETLLDKNNQVKFSSRFLGKDVLTLALSGKLPNISLEEQKILESFKEFYTYFTGYNENRANIFSSDNKSTSAASRLVDENFNRFLSNVKAYEQWQQHDVLIKAINDVEAQLKQNNALDNDINLNQVFSINYYNHLLNQKGINLFNTILGGIPAEENKVKVQGLNEKIKEVLDQEENKGLKDSLKAKKSTKLVPLYKMMLSDRDKSFAIDEFKDGKEAMTVLKDVLNSLTNNSCGVVDKFEILLQALKNGEFNLDSIFIDGKNLADFSTLLFGGSCWSYLSDLILNDSKNKFVSKRGSKFKEEDTLKKINKGFYSIAQLSELFVNDKLQNEVQIQPQYENVRHCQSTDITSIIYASFINSYTKFKESLKVNEWPQSIDGGNGLSGEKVKELVKECLDNVNSIIRLAKILNSSSLDKNMDFYAGIDDFILDISPFSRLYNKIRNYATKKPYSLEKFKLNFKSGTLAQGWHEGELKAKLAIMMFKEGKYYLGIFNKDSKPNELSSIFENEQVPLDSSKYYSLVRMLKPEPPANAFNRGKITEWMDKHFSSGSKEPAMFPDPIKEKSKLKTKYIKSYPVTREMYDIMKSQSYKKDITAACKYIEFLRNNYIPNLRSYSIFDGEVKKLKPSTEYNSFSEFCTDMEKIISRKTFSISYLETSKVDKWVEEGILYLFEIHNKDFSKGHKQGSSKNLHTLYLENLFSAENIANPSLALLGNAELFYRKSSINGQNKFTHKKDQVVVNKLYEEVLNNGKVVKKKIPEDIYETLKDYYKAGENFDAIRKSSNFEETKSLIESGKVKKFILDHDITKDKRFTEDKFFFHVPIKINCTCDGSDVSNKDVIKFFFDNQDTNIIGIDRGERNLIYMTIIDKNGNIIEQPRSFNLVPAQQDYQVDYRDILDKCEQDRDKQRKSWSSIKKISTIKEGYLSLVIHEIAKAAVRYNAMIVLEDLNDKFKKIRGGKAEKSVYQKFEKMLLDKLNYLVVDKKQDVLAPGGVLNGYQLTSKLDTFEELKKQTGFLLYIPAEYTSKIDPVTGFIDNFKLKNITNIEKEKQFFEKFDDISFDDSEDLFKFTVDMSKFDCFVNLNKRNWDIYSVGKRIIYNRKDKKEDIIVLTASIKRTLETQGIVIKSGSLKEEILAVDTSKDKAKFWNNLFYLFKYTLQMRNSSRSNGVVDYLISPVKGLDGKFFNTDEMVSSSTIMPCDADANGAYHIALKGLYVLNKNKESIDKTSFNPDYKCDRKEWLNYVQSRMAKS